MGARISAGHFGEVFLAKDLVHGDVAVKVLERAATESAADWQLRRDGLVKEGQRLKQATHKNVVNVLHVLESETSDAVHLVMEFCSGGSLQAPYEKGPMTLRHVRKVATDVCFGLQALHARGMLHRDIKPGNLLLNSSGITKLGDFGLVTDNIILGYASQAGYADHLAPEIWHGSGTSVVTDVWALGVTLYRLIPELQFRAADSQTPCNGCRMYRRSGADLFARCSATTRGRGTKAPIRSSAHSQPYR